MAMEQQQKGGLPGDLAALLQSGFASDITLVADGSGSGLLAHRAVLAAHSDVFAAMFYHGHGMLEDSTGRVEILDVEEDVLRQMLAFMYMDEVPDLPAVAAKLLVVADKYNIKLLKQKCEEQLEADLCVENAAATAVLAEQYSCSSLKKVSVDFIRKHAVDVMGTADWEYVLQYHTPIVAEVCFISTPVIATSDCRRLPDRSIKDLEKRLLSAAEDGRADEVSVLLAEGVPIDIRDNKGRTALHWAAYSGSDEAVTVLLQAGADVDIRDSLHRTPLHRAASSGHASIVRLLVAASADVNARRDDGTTPLHWAVRWSCTQSVWELVQAGADRSATDESGRTPVDWAVERGRQEIVDILR